MGDDKLTMEQLSDDERRFLMKWRAAPADVQLDVFALLVNGRRRGADHDGNVSDILDLMREKNNDCQECYPKKVKHD